MLKWCAELKQKLAKFNIRNYIQSRLVDDITVLPTVVKPGMRVVNDELKFVKETVEEDSEVSGDVRTMILIQNKTRGFKG